MLLVISLQAQDLEPRFLSPAPVRINFFVLMYGYSVGNVVLDQSLPLEGVEATMHSVTAGYARTIDFFGLSGKVTVVLPLATCMCRGKLNGVDTSTARNGFGGKTRFNGVTNNNDQNNNRIGAALVYPISTAHTLKAIFTSGITTWAGADFDTFALAWQYRWET
jgi:hypothetical protein